VTIMPIGAPPIAARNAAPAVALQCVVCGRPFDFAAGEAAVVLRHVAYGYDFVHDGACLAAARELIFAEPGYDVPAFGRDPERRRVLAAESADGWAAVEPETPARREAGRPVRFEPLRWWALVEHQDGSRHVEGVVRDEEWLDEPGGAELPEARRDHRPFLGYTSLADQASPEVRAA
jgi:hypothetical protein